MKKNLPLTRIAWPLVTTRVRNSTGFGKLCSYVWHWQSYNNDKPACKCGQIFIHLTRPRHRAKCNSSKRLHTNQDEEIRTQQKLQSPKPLVTEEKKHKHNTSSPYFVMLSFKNYISFSTGSIFKSFKLLI